MTECEYVLDKSDQYFTSWTYWVSNFYDYPIINVFSRVYPQSTAGIPIRLLYNSNSKVFINEYIHDSTIKELTEIYVPDFLYLNGYLVSVSNHLNYKIDKDNNLVLVTIDNDWIKKLEVNVMILLKPNEF
jgi:hypothetical protein